MHDLESYPALIEEARLKVDALWRTYYDHEEQAERLKAKYEQEAAENPELTNRNKRKAHVKERMQGQEYQAAKSAKHQAKTKVNEAKARLERLRNEFNVLLSREQKTEKYFRVTRKDGTEVLIPYEDKNMEVP